MKYPYYLLISAFAITLFFSCKKSDDTAPEPESPLVTITSMSPSADSLYPGATVTITGKNFGADKSKINLTLDGQTIPITAADNVSITFTIPEDMVNPAQQKIVTLRISVEGKSSSASQSVTVKWLEPHGWYYPFKPPYAVNESDSVFRTVNFPTESIGFVQRSGWLYRSTDGGVNWSQTYEGSGALYSIDGKNACMAGFIMGVTSTGTGFRFENNYYRFFSAAGLYMSSVVNGVVATQDGQLLSFNGGFDSSHTSLKYKSIYAKLPGTGIVQRWQQMSAIDESNLMLAGFAKIDGSKYTLTVAQEKAGVFNEYDLGYVTSASGSKGLQLIDGNTAFLIDNNNDVLKFTGNINWIKLNQKATAVHFVNANTGYLAYNGKILKTTDGGANWKDEFTLKPGETINAICSKNGKIWAVGNGATSGFILKYNP